eukprot:Rmarinus@m.1079
MGSHNLRERGFDEGNLRITKRTRTNDCNRAVRASSPAPAPAQLLLSNLPVDVLGNIFSRLSDECILLGAVAKVNREFREIAQRTSVREAVQMNFCKAHPTQCQTCGTFLDGAESPSKLRDPLLSATCSNELHCVMFTVLVTKMGVFPCTDPYKRSELLFDAVESGSIKVIRYFVENCGAAGLLQHINGDDETVLHVATREYHLDVIQYLLGEVGATCLLKSTNYDGDTVLHLAAHGGNVEAIEYFMRYGGAKLLQTVNDVGDSVLHAAARGDRVNVIEYFVKRSAAEDFVWQVNHQGETVLHAAASQGCLDVIKYFVDKLGASRLLYETDDRGDTVLHVASRAGCPHIIQYIVEKKRETNMLYERNKRGEAPSDVAHCESQKILKKCYKRYPYFRCDDSDNE